MPGFTSIPNEILDNMASLQPSEFKALIALYRLIIGYEEYRKDNARRLSLSRLAAFTGLSKQGVFNALRTLEKYGYISKKTGGVTTWVVNSVDQSGQLSLPKRSTELTSDSQSDVPSGQLSLPERSTELTNNGQLSLPPSNKRKKKTTKEIKSLSTPKKKTKPKKPNPVFETYQELVKVQRGINKGQALRDVKLLFAAGYSDMDIINCGKFIKSDPFFKERMIPLNTSMITQRIDVWTNAGKPIVFVEPSANGRTGSTHLTPAPASERTPGRQ